MTHSIISLGKAFPLDSLQRAILARWFWQAGGQRFANPCPPTCPAFSVGQNDQLILLRVESGCHLGSLIFNDLEALRMESGCLFGNLIFTEWEWRVTGKTEVIKMRTPVTLLRMRSSYGKRNLILDGSPNSHFGDWDTGNYALRYFGTSQNGKCHFTK